MTGRSVHPDVHGLFLVGRVDGCDSPRVLESIGGRGPVPVGKLDGIAGIVQVHVYGVDDLVRSGDGVLPAETLVNQSFLDGIDLPSSPVEVRNPVHPLLVGGLHVTPVIEGPFIRPDPDEVHFLFVEKGLDEDVPGTFLPEKDQLDVRAHGADPVPYPVLFGMKGILGRSAASFEEHQGRKRTELGVVPIAERRPVGASCDGLLGAVDDMGEGNGGLVEQELPVLLGRADAIVLDPVLHLPDIAEILVSEVFLEEVDAEFIEELGLAGEFPQVHRERLP